MTDIAENLKNVKELIQTAALEADRKADDIDLVAVSKVHGRARIEPALQAGQKIFGENRVQEAQEKWPDLRANYPGVELHLIGPLQTNKVKEAVRLFDVIQTVDRFKLAKKLADEMAAQDKQLDLYIQVNTGEEDQKSGCTPKECAAFVARCRDELSLNIKGLMCIPPVDEEPSLHFALLGKLARDCGLDKLSMGMSGDFETAIRFGATSVRVGTAVFGQRPAFTAP